MERRDRSLVVLSDLQYIDSLNDDKLRAESLQKWVDKNLADTKIENFDLKLSDLKVLSELFYKNISFLKLYRKDIKDQIDSQKKIREFLK